MISVCLASFNGEKYIKEQINSILQQLSDCDELIISDSGSTDNTLNIIEQYRDSRIKIFNIKHQNLSKKEIIATNFENAILHAKGDCIFLSDQDDVWTKNKLKICIYYLQKYDLVVHDCTVVNANKEVILESYYNYRNSKEGFLYNLIKFRGLGCCMCFNRKMLKYIIPLNKKIPHDQWIFFISQFFGKVKFIPQKLILYRRHEQNASSVIERSRLSFFKKISYRLFLIKHLAPRIINQAKLYGFKI